MCESFEFDELDDFTNGRSLSELSISMAQTADLISGVLAASFEALDDGEAGEHGEFGEFQLYYSIPPSSSRT